MLMIARLELWQLSGVYFILCLIQLFMIIIKIEIEGFDSGAKLIAELQLLIGVQQWRNSCELAQNVVVYLELFGLLWRMWSWPSCN